MYFEYVSAQNFVRTVTQGVRLDDGVSFSGVFRRVMRQTVNVLSIPKRLLAQLRKINDAFGVKDILGSFGVIIRGLYEMAGSVAKIDYGRVIHKRIACGVRTGCNVFRGLFLSVRVFSGVVIRDSFLGRFLRRSPELGLKSCVTRNVFSCGLGIGGKIFKGQSALRITLRTFTDLDSVESVCIRFCKPDGSVGEFPAGISDAVNGLVFYECVEGDIDASGWWAFWAFVTFADGRSAAGEAARVFVWEEGK